MLPPDIYFFLGNSSKVCVLWVSSPKKNIISSTILFVPANRQ